MKLLSRLFILSLFFLSKTGTSQVYHFNVYTEDNGLAQNYIYSISQAADGFLYLSTGNGFVSFEGNKFRSYTTKDSLSENFVNTHFIDSRKTVWLGHYQNGISYLEKGEIKKIKKSEDLGSKIISFAEDKKKNVWFVVQGKGVYYIDSLYSMKGPIFSEEENINCIKFDLSGNIICASNDGLKWYNIDDHKRPRLIAISKELENKSIKYLIRDSQNASIYWLGIQGEGVYGVTLKNKKISIVSSITNELASESKTIISIYTDHESHLWISLANEGLKKIAFPPGNNKSKFSISTIAKENGLTSNYIQTIFEDYEYNMWFGTFGNGLIQMPTYKFNFFKPDNASDIKSVLIDSPEYTWLGTSVGLLKYFSENKSKTILYGATNGFVTDQVNALFKDKTGKIWLGCESNGLFIFDPVTEKFENYSKKHNLLSLSINCITQTKSGMILIGTKEGVYFIKPETGKIDLLTTAEGLLHNNARYIFCDSKNRIWFCSDGTPPYFLQNDEITVLRDIEELKSYSINAVSEDLNGLIWISTNGDGIFTYDGKDTKNIRVENGLISNFCYSATLNYNNEMWVTHKNGLSRIKGNKHQVTSYKKSDGLLFVNNNLNAAFSDMKGNVWFGNEEGLVLYNTKRNNNTIPEPKTQILSVILNDKQFLKNDLINLPYNTYTAKIEYIGISLTDASKVMYKYRLLGHDSTWRITDERILEFPKIADGKYTFQVNASNIDGVWTSTPSEISFEIALPIWKRVWFWVIVTMVFGALVFLFIRTRIKGLLRIKERLENVVKERTQQLQIEKEQIESIKIILEEKSKDITDSINYAKRIQESLLPTKESLLASFPKSFIYFKPRDIVSGDFYWFAETDDCYVIAVVDCTGHGIPGAFMSIIGSTILTDIVIDKKITAPDEILTHLNRNIIKLLKQDDEGSSSRDGMDVSICSVNKEKTKMRYSSASRPMYYVRNGVLNEVNLKNHSIGGSYEDYKITYVGAELDIDPNDIYYLFSDGYADQFDTTDRTKFSTKRLKNLFIEISLKDTITQYQIVDTTLNEWKGERGQLDDITIIGFKV